MSLLKRYFTAFFRLIIILIPLGIIAWVMGNSFFSKKGYDGTGDFIGSLWNEVLRGTNANEEVVQLLIDDKGMAFLEKRVEKTKARGIHTNKGGNNYVKGKLVYQGDTLKVDLRIKGHMMDHFQGYKWSFRVKTKGDGLFRNMSRFTFQHPGTRGYVNEWVFHEMARQNELMALQYDFFRLKINGEDRGIYALEEHFGQELAYSNGKTKGSFLRWNPNLYWEGRLDEMDKLTITKNQYMDFSAAYVDPYAEGGIEDNPELLENFRAAAYKLEMFRRGKLSTSEVFDIQKLATLHAIIDLVGGHHSLDWSDVKYFYNGVSEKLEPVAYESFSVRPTRHLAGQRALSFSHGQINDFHDLLFSDMDFYSAYVKELERISESTFLNEFFSSIDEILEEKRAILSQEFPYKRFETQPYYENQNRIRKLLATPLGFYAHFAAIDGDTLWIDAANIHEFPFEITKVECNGEKLKTEAYLLPKKRNLPLEYQRLKFVFDEPLNDKQDKNKIELNFSIPGSSEKRKLDVSLLSAYTSFQDSSIVTTDIPEFFIKDEVNQRFIALQGEWSLKNTVVNFPKDWEVVIASPFVLKLEDGSGLIFNGQVNITGTEVSPVHFSGDKGFLTVQHGELSMKHCVVENMSGNPSLQKGSAAINIIESNAQISFSDFLGNDKNGNGIFSFRSRLIMKQCFSSSWDMVVNSEFSSLNLNHLTFKKSKHGLHLIGSEMTAQKLQFKKVKHPIFGAMSSSGSIHNTTIKDAKHGVEVHSNSHFQVNNIQGEEVENLLKAENHNPQMGPTGISAQKATCSPCQNLQKSTPGTKIEVK